MKQSFDRKELASRMVRYEMAESGQRFMPHLPTIARIDGRAFSKFTKTLKERGEAFDLNFTDVMRIVTKALMQETGAIVGYTQSDEITLVWMPNKEEESWFGLKKMKMTSQLAALASVHFNKEMNGILPQRGIFTETFDARVWQVPNLEEAYWSLVYRQTDAERNSVQMSARSKFSHKALLNKDVGQMKNMLRESGTPWENLPNALKIGSVFKKVKVKRPFTADELDKLPEKHHARTNPDLVIERTDIVETELPRYAINAYEVLFFGAVPVGGG